MLLRQTRRRPVVSEGMASTVLLLVRERSTDLSSVAVVPVIPQAWRGVTQGRRRRDRWRKRRAAAASSSDPRAAPRGDPDSRAHQAMTLEDTDPESRPA